MAGVGVGRHAATTTPRPQRRASAELALEAAVAELRSRCGADPPIWLASWGATVRAAPRRPPRRRLGRLGVCRPTPEAFAARWARLRELLAADGRDPDAFGNIVAHAVLLRGARRPPRRPSASVAGRLAPRRSGARRRTSSRSAPRARRRRSPRAIHAYADAGAQRIHLWPAADPPAQIERASLGRHELALRRRHLRLGRPAADRRRPHGHAASRSRRPPPRSSAARRRR